MNNSLSESVEIELTSLAEVSAECALGAPGGHIHSSVIKDGGRLLRPRILFLCVGYGESLGRSVDWESARTAALALNLGHTGSLYHDDIVDRSDRRRGGPSVHATFGARAAAVGGGQLLARANALAMSLPHQLPQEWGRAAVLMAEGQLEELQNIANYSLPAQDYLDIAAKKTATAFELAATFGAVLGAHQPHEARSLRQFGHHYGLAFQLYNDLHDFSRGPEHRPAANDLRERNYTLPILYACAQDEAIGEALRESLADDGKPLRPETIDRVVRLLHESGSFARAESRANTELASARQCLRVLAPCHPTTMLADLADDLEAQGTGASLL